MSFFFFPYRNFDRDFIQKTEKKFKKRKKDARIF